MYLLIVNFSKNMNNLTWVRINFKEARSKLILNLNWSKYFLK